MAVCDVPVQTSQQLVVAFIGREVSPTTSVIAVFLAHVVRYSGKVSICRTRNVVVGISGIVSIRAPPAVDDCWDLDHLTVDEEEEFVLDDRTTQRESVCGGLRLLTST